MRLGFCWSVPLLKYCSNNNDHKIINTSSWLLSKSFDILDAQIVWYQINRRYGPKNKISWVLTFSSNFFISSPFISVSHMFINFIFFLGHTQTIESVHKIIWIWWAQSLYDGKDNKLLVVLKNNPKRETTLEYLWWYYSF
jgi:hypothetical protein